MWDLPRPGLELVSPALAGRFSTTAPPGKPLKCIFYFHRIFNFHYSIDLFSCDRFPDPYPPQFPYLSDCWSPFHLLCTIKMLLLLWKQLQYTSKIFFFSLVCQDISHILFLKQKTQDSLCLAVVTSRAWNLSSYSNKVFLPYKNTDVSLVTSQGSCFPWNDFISHQAASKLCLCPGNMRLPQSPQEGGRNWRVVQGLLMS